MRFQSLILRACVTVAIAASTSAVASSPPAAAAAGPGQRLVARYEVYCRARGIYSVGPAEVAVTDPFGLTERRAALGSADRLTVYPAVEVLAGRFVEGDVILVEPDGETLQFRKEVPAAVAS